MIKLLKYDWKRNANTFLGIAVVLALLEGVVNFIGITKHWDSVPIITLSIMLYVSAGIFMIVLGCKTLDHNIKAYHRRLLPVHPIWTVLSSLLISWIAVLLVLAVMLVHGAFYINYGTLPGEIDWHLIEWKPLIWGIVIGVWEFTFVIITLFMSITIGAWVSIRGKMGTWIGIVSFILIHNIIGYINNLLFGPEGEVFTLGFVHVQSGANEIITNTPMIYWGPFILEVVFAGLMVWGMTYLINKKMEI